ncbi:hypothetical protein ACLH0K_13920 [Arthrobacter sp. MPF02]|uniref:hypothetical protein n=1 Tax=Arthrobacter sp. MPF02 TaxID=3388492 RepID=UPI003985600A
MPELPPLLLSRDRIFHGLTPNDLTKRVKTGALVRVRNGIYTDGEAWRGLKPWEQYRLRVQAAAESFRKPTVFARHSAASVWGLPIIGTHHPVEALTFRNDGGRSRAGVSRHFALREGLTVVRREGLLVTDRVRTVLDLAAFSPFTEGVTAMDHVLRHDRLRQLPALGTAELEAGIGSNYSAAAGRRIRAVLEFACPASGSAGESLSRVLIHLAGFEPPVLQQAFTDSSGLVGYSDFYWKHAGVVGEFDGEEKYTKSEYLKGRTASQAVVAEKNRENRIRALGINVVRWDWADLMEPGTLERKLGAAGVSRRRTRSAVPRTAPLTRTFLSRPANSSSTRTFPGAPVFGDHQGMCVAKVASGRAAGATP